MRSVVALNGSLAEGGAEWDGDSGFFRPLNAVLDRFCAEDAVKQFEIFFYLVLTIT